MKIGIDIRTIGKNRTGDETYTRELVKSLLKIDKKNQYFLYTDSDDPDYLARVKKILQLKKGQKAQVTPVLPRAKMFWTFWSLPAHIRKNPIDILHVQYITPQFLPKKTKVITTIHDVSFNQFPQMIKKSDLFLLKTLIPLSLRRADKVIAVSQFTKKEIGKYYRDIQKEKIATVYNGGASEEFYQEYSRSQINKILDKYKINSNYVLYVGTLQPRKNIPFLIEAFSHFKEKNKDKEFSKNLKLVVCGSRESHNYDRNIDAALEKAGDVSTEIIFPGYIEEEDLPALLQGAKVFAFPSLYEGFGLPLLEAMASGVPVLCSDDSCNKEISASAALLYRQSSKNDFSAKLVNLLMDGHFWSQLREKGKTRSKDFLWEKCARQTLEVYNAALS